jgi:DNA-binding NarL/FixJ family response regulator
MTGNVDRRSEPARTEGRNIRLLIVDDDALVRAGLAMLLGGAADLEIVGEAEDGTQVLAAIDAHRPDVVLMDIRMPKLDGLAATRLVRGRPDAPQVIVLTTFDVDDHVLTALRDGAAGFLVKDTPPTEILRAIRLVAAGDAMLSPSVTRKLLDFMVADDAPAVSTRALAALGELTEREREVAVAVGHGSSNAEVAAELYMSIATVKAHVSRLLMKLDLDNRVQIALLVHDAGLSAGTR